MTETGNQETDGMGATGFYARLLQRLREERVPFLVGGSYAFTLMTGIQRPTKDLDIFIREANWKHLACVARAAGWQAELRYRHWLGKVLAGTHFVDAIFSSGNGLSPVDDEWFRHALPGRLFDQPVLLVPAEESVWTKAFVMERERFDGADVAHLLLACAPQLNWRRLLHRFGPHWRVLLAHLTLFGFIYPGRRGLVPAWLMDELICRLQVEAEHHPVEPDVCAGTLLSREQYLHDLGGQRFVDARTLPANRMSDSDIADWTAAIGACIKD